MAPLQEADLQTEVAVVVIIVVAVLVVVEDLKLTEPRSTGNDADVQNLSHLRLPARLEFTFKLFLLPFMYQLVTDFNLTHKPSLQLISGHDEGGTG